MYDERVKRDYVHCGNAGVTDEDKDKNVEDGLVFVITTYYYFVFARLFFLIKINLCRKNFLIALDVEIVRMSTVLNCFHYR